MSTVINQLFIRNKYTKWYYSIITKFNSKLSLLETTEEHHIIPRSLGGDNSKNNLVHLPVKAHFIVHHLLSKMTTGVAKRKMHLALFMMQYGKGKSKARKEVRITAKVYENIKKERRLAISEILTGQTRSIEARRNMSKAQKNSVQNQILRGPNNPGKNPSKETKAKMSASGKGHQRWLGKTHSEKTKAKMSYNAKNRTVEHNHKISMALTGKPSANKGRVFSEEHKAKLKKPKSEEHKANLRKPKQKEQCPHCLRILTKNNRYHFDNCKLKPI